MDAKLEKRDQLNIPKHLGIILDGNGRWAQKRGLSRSEGHIQGSENVITITEFADDLGVEVLSLYAFSSENWKRPKSEVSMLMELLVKFIHKYLPRLMRNNVRLITMGDLSRLPFTSRQAIEYAKKKTTDNTGLILNIGLNYGGRDEITRAVKKIAKEVKEDKLSLEDVDEKLVSSHLDTAGLPDPDLLIRTGGELRLSNFMIYQMAYTEFYFTNVLWPDFSPDNLITALEDYTRRDRRFGGLST